MEDTRIIALYNERSEDAIRETDLKYGRMCTSIAHNILKRREDAEECVSDTWLRAWNTIPPEQPSCLSAFLSKIVRNLSLNRLKFLQTKKRGGSTYYVALDELDAVLADEKMSADPVDELFLRDLLNTFLEQLPEDSRLVFIGRYWHFDSIKDIAAATGFSVSKTKMLLLRARNDLKEYLRKEGVFL
ncbi:MAG: sigma-70 family RNA polymerase sigma factor [Lachnospiraceae bacterium]|nr:sigma-70 family RNA polymerase sigma factor [Lachnospiraceae bacterium]